jgi:hypothetical protein
MPRSLADRVRPRLEALRYISANPGLLRLELGSLAWSTADAAYLVGLLVLAYDDGGTAAVAFVASPRRPPSPCLSVPEAFQLTEQCSDLLELVRLLTPESREEDAECGQDELVVVAAELEGDPLVRCQPTAF